jgi:heat shock protein HslJ
MGTILLYTTSETWRLKTMFRNKGSLQKLTLLMVILALGLTGCAALNARGEASGDAGKTLANTKWRLVEMGAPGAETPDLAQANVTLEFDDQGRAAGRSACNSYGGSVTVNGETIAFGEIASTMMACADPARMQLEQDYLAALNNADRFELGQDSLTIFYSGGPARLVFARQ